MLFKLSSYWFKVEAIDRTTIKAICAAFRHNPRMQALLGKHQQTFEHKLKVLISFCYFMVKKLGGIFVSQNRAAFLLYYQKSKHYFSIRDLLHYVYLAIKVIGLSKLVSTFQREQQVKNIRQHQAESHGEKDYLYVWFLAQTQAQKSLTGLIEAKNHLFQRAAQLNLPIYMETTEARLVAIYQRLGFQFYKKHHDTKANLNIWFGRLAADEVRALGS